MKTKFNLGQFVKTNPKEDRDFTPETILTRKQGEGIIIDFHDSHGLCYDVRHPDGIISCYDPDELTAK